MQTIDRGPRDQYTTGLVDCIAGWLDQRNRAQAFSIVLLTTAIIAALDYSFDEFEICIATLYIAPLCLSCWMFGPRQAVATTLAVATLAFAKYPVVHQDPVISTTMCNGIARILAFALLTAIMLAFRRNYDLL